MKYLICIFCVLVFGCEQWHPAQELELPCGVDEFDGELWSYEGRLTFPNEVFINCFYQPEQGCDFRMQIGEWPGMSEAAIPPEKAFVITLPEIDDPFAIKNLFIFSDAGCMLERNIKSAHCTDEGGIIYYIPGNDYWECETERTVRFYFKSKKEINFQCPGALEG